MIMENLVTKWDEFASALLELLPELMRKPIVYAVVLLIVIVITALCSIPSKKDKISHSVLGLITYSFKILLSFIGSALTAIESITNFIDVVRIILRGKLTDGTQFLLNNYAIVALSVASFYTTFNGLLQVSNWYIAILITFGVQVGILALSSKIALKRNRKKEGKYLRNITYEWVRGNERQKLYLGDDETREYVERKVDSDKLAAKQWKNAKEAESRRERVKTQWDKKTKKEKGYKYYPFLFLCIMVSSYFSYVHFYEVLVHPGAPMDNYISAMNKAADIVSDYSGDLIEVQGIFQRYLQDYNAQVRKEYSSEIEAVQKIIQYQDQLEDDLRKAREEVMDIELKIQNLRDTLPDPESEAEPAIGAQGEDVRSAEEISAEIAVLESYSLDPAQRRLDDIQDEYDSRQEQIDNNSGYVNVQQIEKALNELESFYRNPLYLDNEGISEVQLQADLSNLMNYEMAHMVSDGEYEEEANERYNNLNIVFNNYLGLCRYYVQNGAVGMNPKVLQEARDDQEYVISEYTQAVKRERELEDKEKEAESETVKAADFLNNETAKILMQMIVELNRIPGMEIWSDIQEEDRKSLNQLEAHEYNKELYDRYRISSGNISMLEEAVRVRGTKGIAVSILMLVMALFVDIMTFILTVVKGVDNYGNKLPLLRKIIYTIFFKERLSEIEKHIAKVRRWVGGMSLAVGLLLFIIYYSITETQSNAVKAAALVAIVMGSMLVGCLLIYIYERIYESRMYWKNEEAYRELMNFFNIDREKRGNALQKKLDDYIAEQKELTLSVKELQRISELLVTGELEEDENVLTQRAKSLLGKIEISLLLRINMESHYIDREKSAKQFLKEGWQEYVYMAVLEEKYVKDNYYNKEFAVLKSRELIYCVEDEKNTKYYVLSDLFMKILYDLIMEENSGSALDAELSFAEHISDYYEEQEIL